MSEKSYEQLKAEMEAIQQQMVAAEKNERANALKEVNTKKRGKYFPFLIPFLAFNLFIHFKISKSDFKYLEILET